MKILCKIKHKWSYFPHVDGTICLRCGLIKTDGDCKCYSGKLGTTGSSGVIIYNCPIHGLASEKGSNE